MPTKHHIPALDHLRGIAVLLVLWTHIPQGYLGESADVLRGFVQPGYLGVDLFFVLSGFLITRILLVDKGKALPLRYFLMRRFLRIFPIYYLLLAVMLVVARGPELGWCALYASNFYFPFSTGHSVLRHTWSLAVEEHYYLLWPLLVYAMPVVLSRRMLLWVVIPGSIGCAVLACGAMQWDWSRSWLQSTFSADSLDHYDAAAFISMGTMFRALSLAFGSLIAYSEPAVVRRAGTVMFVSLVAFVAAQCAIIARTQWGDWYPPVRLAGFTVVSGSLVLAAIAASGASAAGSKAREMNRALRLTIAAIACVGAEIVALVGLRWLVLEKDLSSRSLGVAALIVAVGMFSGGAIALARIGTDLAHRLGAWLEPRQAAAAGILAATAGLSALLALHYDSLIVRLPPGLLGVAGRLSAAGAVTITGAALLASAAICGQAVVRSPRLRRTHLAPALAILAALGVMVAVLTGSPSEPAAGARVSVPSFQLAFTVVAWSVILTVTSGLAAPIGRISYGLYLYHPPIFYLFGLRLIDADSPLRPLWMLAAVLSALATAALSYRIIERPILRFAARFREGNPHTAPPGTQDASPDAVASLNSRP